MKKYLLLITILISTSYLHVHSQNDIDPPILPSGINDTIFSFDSTRIIHRMDDNFIIGWNYGRDGRQLDEIYNINTIVEYWENSNFNWQHRGDETNWYLRMMPFDFPADYSVGAGP